MTARERSRRRQAGTTLIELIVSMAILSLALMLLVGAFSTGVIQSTLVKRTTAANGALEYELERVAGATYDSTPSAYSECFANDSASAPTPVGYRAGCPSGSSLRADVTESDVHAGLQQWTVAVATYPALDSIGSPVSVYKTQR